MSKEKVLAPCPHCRNEEDYPRPNMSDNGLSFWVFCPSCGAHGPAAFNLAEEFLAVQKSRDKALMEP